MSDEYELFEFMENDNNLNNLDKKRKRRVTRTDNDAFELEDEEFIKEYRLSPDLTLNLIDELTPFLKKPKKSSDLSIETKVLTALSFFAHGSYQRPTGDRRALSIAQQTVSTVLAEVTAAMNTTYMRSKYIQFPRTQEERNNTKVRFYEKFGIPGVLGCVDGTHVAIVRPNHHEERYYCRKQYHSLNVQLICNADMEFTSVDASYGGATHDSFIWLNHPIRPYLEELSNNEGVWLLGDSGYPQRKIMMTPILNAVPDTPESHYTEVHVSTRNIIERAIGVLKARFRCLLVHRTLHYAPNVAGLITNACTILHNIVNKESVPFEELSEEEALREAQMQPTVPHVEAQSSVQNNNDLQIGINTRNSLVNRLWEMRVRLAQRR